MTTKTGHQGCHMRGTGCFFAVRSLPNTHHARMVEPSLLRAPMLIWLRSLLPAWAGSAVGAAPITTLCCKSPEFGCRLHKLGAVFLCPMPLLKNVLKTP